MNSPQGNFGRDYEDYSHLKASSCLSQKPNLFFNTAAAAAKSLQSCPTL